MLIDGKARAVPEVRVRFFSGSIAVPMAPFSVIVPAAVEFKTSDWVAAVVPFTTATVMVPPLLLIVVSPARVVVAAPKLMTLLAVFCIVPARL